MRRRVTVVIAAAGLVVSSLVASAAAKRPALAIEVLSGRADLVSAGSALVVVAAQSGAQPGHVRVSLDRRDVTSWFALRADGQFEGLVRGMTVGPHRLVATAPGMTGAEITLLNHLSSGPVFAGPQLQPWTCQTGAVDKQCDQPPSYQYSYLSTDPTKSGLQPYDPAAPASDVASTTTDGGVTVPYIVREETGYLDRNQYNIATLYRPGEPWTPFQPQRQWNHKLLVLGGSGCGVSYQVQAAPSVTGGSANGDPALDALGRGYMTMATALDNSGSYCDPALQAESLVMTKEHLIKTYGTVLFTMGQGCSGGSLMLHWVSNAYPGIFQGIVGGCSYNDAGTAALHILDDALVVNYFQNPQTWTPGTAWTPTQISAVLGTPYIWSAWLYTGCLHIAGQTPVACQGLIFPSAVPDRTCPGITDAQRYDPTARPGGVRCSIVDLNVNLLGRRRADVWSPAEKKIGHGFAGLPFGNVGVQYGLGALKAGTITAAQFVDLNAAIGGLDTDAKFSPHRMVADRPALGNAYRTGIVNTASNLDQTAIIFCGQDDTGVVHDAYRPFSLRARLDREHGGHGNQLIWDSTTEYKIPDNVGTGTCWSDAFAAMDRWLTAIAHDASARSEAQKVLADKPAGLTDRCYDATTVTASVCAAGTDGVYPSPRMVAGDGLTAESLQCRLTPLKRSSYRGRDVLGTQSAVTFTDAQWAMLTAAFPYGVCDFTRPAEDQQRTVPWLTYSDARGAVVYGGTPLGPAPKSQPIA